MLNGTTRKVTAREKRGEISPDFVFHFSDFLDEDLIKLLTDRSPQIRAAAAKILGERKCLMAIPALCNQFKQEKALYARIAISNALSSIGVAALPELTKSIGRIGNNQHWDLPREIFKKWNYPLPRDVAVRCIIRMGAPALEELNKSLLTGDETILCEIIDAIGHISFYSHDQSSFDNLMVILTKYQGNKVITWKTIRALQAFPNQQTTKVLSYFLFYSEIPQYRWEAARSLGQIATENVAEYLDKARKDPYERVQAMVKLSLEHIGAKINKFRG